MGKLILGMNVSIDGYVDDLGGNLVMGAPSQKHFDYWIETIRGHTGAIYGRRIYELMRYWDDEHSEWDAPLRDFAVAWRSLPKYRRRLAATVVDQANRLTTIEAELLEERHQYSIINNLYGKLQMQVDREKQTGHEQATQQTLMATKALTEARNKIAQLEAEIEAFKSR